MNVSLNPALEKFIQDQVRNGEYSSADEVIAAGLTLLQHDPDADLSPEELENLRREIQIGIDQADRGELAPWNAAEARALGQKLLAEQRKKAI